MRRVDGNWAPPKVSGDLRSWCLLAMIVAGCAGSPLAGSSTATSLVSPSAVASAAPVATSSPAPAPTPSASPRPALVGQWELDRTCQAIVAALTKAGHPELIRGAAGEL